MNSKKLNNSYLILFLFFFGSCDFRQVGNKLEKVNNSISSAFEHENVRTKLNVGTDGKDNFIRITFYDFDLNKEAFNQLKKMADSVNANLINSYPEFKKLNFVEVRFTIDKNEEEIKSYTSFKRIN